MLFSTRKEKEKKKEKEKEKRKKRKKKEKYLFKNDVNASIPILSFKISSNRSSFKLALEPECFNDPSEKKWATEGLSFDCGHGENCEENC